MMRADLEAAGVPYADGAGKIADFHSLRHTFISNLVAGGVHPKVAQTLARHSSITLTMDHYTHVAIGGLVSALGTLPDFSAPEAEVHAEAAVTTAAAN
ncbi:MAG: tyrosine-type recombinase/integrase [Planctomycetes bacterium]|nr:tyrosine-type recombinase/integrase [Planctomycetota bacterium]